jgi:hypothetical protein
MQAATLNLEEVYGKNTIKQMLKNRGVCNRKSQATDFCSVLFPEIVPQFIVDFIVKKYRFIGSFT